MDKMIKIALIAVVAIGVVKLSAYLWKDYNRRMELMNEYYMCDLYGYTEYCK